MGSGTVSLSDYHLGLLGQEKAKPYLKALLDPNYKEIIAEINSGPGGVKELLDKKGYLYYKHVLNTKTSKDRREWFEDRDYSMFRRVLFLDSLFTGKNEKTVILVHSEHLKKIPHITIEGHNPVLGTLLNQHFGAKHFNIDFTVGEGTFIQDSCRGGSHLITDALKSAPEDSFEYAALNTGIPYFYSPSVSLRNQTGRAAKISRQSRGKNYFTYTVFVKKADGYVFQRNSDAFDDVEKKPFSYAMDFYDGRRRLHRNVLGLSRPTWIFN